MTLKIPGCVCISCTCLCRDTFKPGPKCLCRVTCRMIVATDETIEQWTIDMTLKILGWVRLSCTCLCLCRDMIKLGPKCLCRVTCCMFVAIFLHMSGNITKTNILLWDMSWDLYMLGVSENKNSTCLEATNIWWSFHDLTWCLDLTRRLMPESQQKTT